MKVCVQIIHNISNSVMSARNYSNFGDVNEITKGCRSSFVIFDELLGVDIGGVGVTNGECLAKVR